MKKILPSLALVLTSTLASAQLQINPQIGLLYQNLTDAPNGTSYKADLGWQVGADLRLGDKFFLQPGIFLARTATVVGINTTTPDGQNIVTSQIEDNLVRTSLKLRALGGVRLIDTYQFDLRFLLGPSYDVLMSVDNKDDKIDWNKGDFNGGSWNIETGVGLDMGMITLAPTVSFGLSRAYSDNVGVKDIDSKYITYGLTLGVNFGDDDK